MNKLKFIVDECVGFLVAHWLKQNGFDTISVLAEMSGAKDSQILIKVLDELFKNHFDELSGNFVVVADANVRVIKQLYH